MATATVNELLDRARHRLELRYADPPAQDLLRGVPGVAERAISGRTVLIAVDGPVGPALRAAAGHPGLLRVRSAGVEELFVSLYERHRAEVS